MTHTLASVFLTCFLIFQVCTCISIRLGGGCNSCTDCPPSRTYANLKEAVLASTGTQQIVVCTDEVYQAADVPISVTSALRIQGYSETQPPTITLLESIGTIASVLSVQQNSANTFELKHIHFQGADILTGFFIAFGGQCRSARIEKCHFEGLTGHIFIGQLVANVQRHHELVGNVHVRAQREAIWFGGMFLIGAPPDQLFTIRECTFRDMALDAIARDEFTFDDWFGRFQFVDNLFINIVRSAIFLNNYGSGGLITQLVIDGNRAINVGSFVYLGNSQDIDIAVKFPEEIRIRNNQVEKPNHGIVLDRTDSTYIWPNGMIIVNNNWICGANRSPIPQSLAIEPQPGLGGIMIFCNEVACDDGDEQSLSVYEVVTINRNCRIDDRGGEWLSTLMTPDLKRRIQKEDEY